MLGATLSHSLSRTMATVLGEVMEESTSDSLLLPCHPSLLCQCCRGHLCLALIRVRALPSMRRGLSPPPSLLPISVLPSASPVRAQSRCPGNICTSRYMHSLYGHVYVCKPWTQRLPMVDMRRPVRVCTAPEPSANKGSVSPSLTTESKRQAEFQASAIAKHLKQQPEVASRH